MSILPQHDKAMQAEAKLVITKLHLQRNGPRLSCSERSCEHPQQRHNEIESHILVTE